MQSINPIFIIVLSGVFAALWTKLGRRQPLTPITVAMGTIVMGITFLLFIPMASTAPHSAPLLGQVGVLFVFTLAELLISPVSLSLATTLAPELFRTQMVALLLLSIALGTAMAGVLAGYYSDQNQVTYFGILGSVAIVVGAVLVAVTPVIRRLKRGDRQQRRRANAQPCHRFAAGRAQSDSGGWDSFPRKRMSMINQTLPVGACPARPA